MKIARHILAIFFLLLTCAYAQTVIISAPAKDPEVKPEQKTAAIVHYEKMRFTARSVIHDLAVDLQNPDSPKAKLNEVINYQTDIVEWANWCILALRDKTAEAKACVIRTDLK